VSVSFVDAFEEIQYSVSSPSVLFATLLPKTTWPLLCAPMTEFERVDLSMNWKSMRPLRLLPLLSLNSSISQGTRACTPLAQTNLYAINNPVDHGARARVKAAATP
jgi:hypothetical protein